MPQVNANLIPLATPGSVFNLLTDNSSLAVRWVQPEDPHLYETYNRPMADIVIRQLIIAKSLDAVGLRLSHQSNFPFLVPCTIDVASSVVNMPVAFIWDMHVSLSSNYEDLRLAQLVRLSGTNDDTNGYTGKIRFIFTGKPVNGTNEVGLFYADYQIDSNLSFQIVRVTTSTNSIYNPSLSSSESETIDGFVVFRTLDTNVESDFFDAIAPGIGAIVTGTNATDDAPVYNVTDTIPGGTSVTNDFSLSAISHGTGILVQSAYNLMPPSSVQEDAVLAALNYPFRPDTTLVDSQSKSTIPSGMFSQFAITAPMGDRRNIGNNLVGSGASHGDPYPVILTKVRRINATADDLEFTFSTYNTIIGSVSEQLTEFGTLTLSRDASPGDRVEIFPAQNLINNSDSEFYSFYQNFGSGYVILSDKWAVSNEIVNFFDVFLSVTTDPPILTYSAYLNEFAVHRVPNTIQTIGQALAAQGSTSRRDNPIHPSDSNRYVMESDIGLGDEVTFSDNGFSLNNDLSNTGYRGSLLRRLVVWEVNTANDTSYTYDEDILPRLRLLFGRDPVVGDEWYDGTVFKKYNGSTWIG